MSAISPRPLRVFKTVRLTGSHTQPHLCSPCLRVFKAPIRLCLLQASSCKPRPASLAAQGTEIEPRGGRRCACVFWSFGGWLPSGAGTFAPRLRSTHVPRGPAVAHLCQPQLHPGSPRTGMILTAVCSGRGPPRKPKPNSPCRAGHRAARSCSELNPAPHRHGRASELPSREIFFGFTRGQIDDWLESIA